MTNATPTRIYIVQPVQANAGNGIRLVRTENPTRALRHVTDVLYEVRVATQEDLEMFLGTGYKVERPHANE